MGLAPVDEAALARMGDASPEQLRQAVARMPRYQRDSLRWLARELDLLARVPTVAGGGSKAPELERIAQRILLERARLEREITGSAATPAQKAFMQQNLAHLWAAVKDLLRSAA